MADEFKKKYTGLHNVPYGREGINWPGLLSGFAEIPRGLLAQVKEAALNPRGPSLLSKDQVERLDKGDVESVDREFQAERSARIRAGLGALPLVGPLIGAGYAVGDQLDTENTFDRERALAATLGTLAMVGVPAKKGAIKRSTELKNLRGLSTEEAIAIARLQPHRIKSGDRSEGLHVGGPRDIKTAAELLRQRRKVDQGIDAGALGGDWYDRYRASVNEVTGGDPIQNRWMTSQEGQWSAGVDPRSELGFALKENNASIAGMPTKSARPAQHEAHLAAIEAKDPSLYQLGEKTGEYQQRIEPRPPGSNVDAGATGVNDFRWAAEHGFTEPGGASQRSALTDAQHRYLDYETALAVDRANKRAAGGRADWTGEQVQAAGWVRQKADSILEKRTNEIQSDVDRTTKQAQKMGLSKEETAAAVAKVRTDHDARAFAEANRQIGDFFPANTAYATHESRPGSQTGHLPGLLSATPDEIARYHADPASTWATAPGGRDAIYAGTGIPDTGVNMRVRPTKPMQGAYERPDGTIEFNPGETANPLVAFQTNPGAPKTIAAADRKILDAGETWRGLIDAQNAGAWHKPYAGGPTKQSNSVFVPLDRKLSETEMVALKAEAKARGLPDVVDTGSGVTLTSFYPQPEVMTPKVQKSLESAVKTVLPDALGLERTAVSSGFLDLGKLQDVPTPWGTAPGYKGWESPPGSNVLTQFALDQIRQPQLRTAFQTNPYLPERAGAKLARDEGVAAQYGAPRADLQALRAEIAKGGNWADRVEHMIKTGTGKFPVLLPFGLAGTAVPGLLTQSDDDRRY